ncbi:MAG TPA: oligosaccharide flippase family protein [Longimicrobiales bacterium]|nr:oligosaccharide flippase family protein [Longimicrobiales bacterium]
MRELHERARRGIRLLVGRQAATQLLSLAGGIVVARTLGPAPIGVFGIAVFLVTALSLLADMGLRTALIQHAAPPTELQLATCFTLQQLVVTGLAILLFAGAPAIATMYPAAPPELVWLIRLLALDLYLRSWRALSEVRLERDLRYRELALADLVGSAAYQVVAVGLVLSGWGVRSLGVALLAGSLLRAGLLFRAAPWPVRFELHPATLRALLRAGLPLQVNRIVMVAPAWVTPTLVAGLLGPQAAGLLVWASTLGRKPLEVLENVVRVSLPQFARLQNDVVEVERVLGRYAAASLLVCGLWFSVLATAGHDLVALVYTERWLPAMPALLLYAGTGLLASVRWLANAAIVGVGRARFAARVSASSAGVAIALSVILVLKIGFLGVPIGQLAGIAIATPWLLRGLRPGTPALVLRAALPVLVPVASALAAGALARLLPLPPAPRGLLTAGVAAATYVATTWWTGGQWLRSTVLEELALPARLLRRSATG